MQNQKIDVIRVKRIDRENLDVQLMTIEDKLEEFHKQIDCRTIDIIRRKFGGVDFNIILDDEALLKEDPGFPTSWWQDTTGNYTPGYEGLFGTLLLCHCDETNGELLSVDPLELLNVLNCCKLVMTKNGEKLGLLFHDIR